MRFPRLHPAMPVVGVITALALLPACGKELISGNHPIGVGTVPAEKLGFVRHTGAVAWPSVSDWVPPGSGLQHLMPYKDCVLGIGDYRNGYRTVATNWTGDLGCTRLGLDPAPDGRPRRADGPLAKTGGWNGGGLWGRAVVTDGNGGFIGVDSEIQRRDKDGKITSLADLGLPHNEMPEEGGDIGHALSIVRVGKRLIIGGHETIGGKSRALLWASTDGGATVKRITLPVSTDPKVNTDFPAAMAAGGDHVVATAFASGTGDPQARRLSTWSSDDGGQHWELRVVDGLPDTALVHGIVRTGQRWVVFGAVNDPKAPDHPFLLTSADGKTWTMADTSSMGLGGIVAATVDKAGRTVLVGHLDQVDSHQRSDQRERYCGVTWVGDVTSGWQRGELGCGDAPPTAAATLTDGRVLIAGNRDLWIRS